jgi:large subunit ribosomal protein L18
LSVYRSNRAFFAQLIDDNLGVTVASVFVRSGNIDGAKLAAEGISKKYNGDCVFDRNGYAYHGRVRAFADRARELGLNF